MSQGSGWDRRLVVAADGKNTVGHAGVVLLRRLADRVGLTGALGACFEAGGPGRIDRGVVLVQAAVAIAAGARNVVDVERLGLHHGGLFGRTGSDSTLLRTLAETDDALLGRLARSRARARKVVWSLLALRPGGFPWLRVAGKKLTGWLVVDLDATIVTCESAKDGAAGTFKRTFGFHPLAAWVANTMEPVAMLLRPGNAGANTATDHKTVLAAAFAQIPGLVRARILVRTDGAGASKAFTRHLAQASTTRRTVLFTTGWKMTDLDEQAIALVPAGAWEAMLDQDGEPYDHDHGGVTEITLLDTRLTHDPHHTTDDDENHDQDEAQGWPAGLRLIARRVRPSKRDHKKLTAFEKKTGWKYQVVATNIPLVGLNGAKGSGQAQWIDAAHRHHAVVEDRVRTNKTLGLRALPSKRWDVNRGWVLAANLAADLDAWLRLLVLHDEPDLARAEPDTMRFRLYTVPARLTSHARKTWLRLNHDWPWAKAAATAWQRLAGLTPPAIT